MLKHNHVNFAVNNTNANFPNDSLNRNQRNVGLQVNSTNKQKSHLSTKADSCTSPLIEDSPDIIRCSHGIYEEVVLIGSGSYGTVFKARDFNNDKLLVALKKVNVPLDDEGIPISLLREITLLKQLQNFEHPNIVRLLDICHGKRSENKRQLIVFLVFEHVEQDLDSYMKKFPEPGINSDRIKKLIFQLLTGVDFLHSNCIVHRDLKPANILVTNEGQLKIADFGMARIYQKAQPLTEVVVTLWYRAPEILLQSSYASPVDMWSVGCIFAEFFIRQPIFCGQSENDQLCKILEIIGAPSRTEWPEDLSLPWEIFAHFKKKEFCQIISKICSEGNDLLEEMLKFDKTKRIEARKALTHQYFTE